MPKCENIRSFYKMAYTELKFLPINITVCTGVVSHSLLLICLLKDPLKCFRNSATYLIMNLALSDFLVSTVRLLQMLLFERISTLAYISNSVMLASLFSIFSIAIDRFILTVHPFKHRVLLNGRRITIWIATIWLPCFCSLVKELIADHEHTIDRIIYNTIFIVFTSVTFLIYILTYLSLKKRGQEISQRQTQSGNRVAEKAFLKTIMIVAFVQILTLAPACIYGLVQDSWSVSDIDGDSDDFSVKNLILLEMYALNFAVNPFLYLWRLKNYRKTFRLIFCRKLY